jgi:hypothetical protein
MTHSIELADPMKGMTSENFDGPVFIVGMPRSGTKVLREVLLGNAQLKIPRLETHFFPDLAAYIDTRGGALRTRPEFERMYRWVQGFQYFKYSRRGGKLITSATWFQSSPNLTAAGIFEGLIRHDADAAPGSRKIWGDKSPSYITHISLLARHFPRARFVHIVRDPRDQVLSMRNLWGKDILRAAQRWADDVQAALEQGESIGPRCLLVRYEDLVEDPSRIVQNVCDFLNLEFDESMLSLTRPAEKVGVASGKRAILKGNSNKFMAAFSARELAAIESITGEIMSRVAYAPLEPRSPMRLSAVSMAVRQAKDVLALVKSRKSIAGWGWISAIRFYTKSR